MSLCDLIPFTGSKLIYNKNYQEKGIHLRILRTRSTRNRLKRRTKEILWNGSNSFLFETNLKSYRSLNNSRIKSTALCRLCSNCNRQPPGTFAGMEILHSNPCVQLLCFSLRTAIGSLSLTVRFFSPKKETRMTLRGRNSKQI